MTATLTTLPSIGASDSNLIADANVDLFGTSNGNGVGSVFEIVKTASGYASTATTLATFDFDDGYFAAGGLFADAEGNLLGMTRFGGAVAGARCLKLRRPPVAMRARQPICSPSKAPTARITGQPDRRRQRRSVWDDDLRRRQQRRHGVRDQEDCRWVRQHANSPVSFNDADGEEPILDFR